MATKRKPLIAKYRMRDSFYVTKISKKTIREIKEISETLGVHTWQVAEALIQKGLYTLGDKVFSPSLPIDDVIKDLNIEFEEGQNDGLLDKLKNLDE